MLQCRVHQYCGGITCPPADGILACAVRKFLTIGSLQPDTAGSGENVLPGPFGDFRRRTDPYFLGLGKPELNCPCSASGLQVRIMAHQFDRCFEAAPVTARRSKNGC